jgi:hypothetical protein
MYGVIDTFGFATPARRDPAFGPVMLIRNSAGNHAITATAEVQKRLESGFEFRVSYSYTRSRDRFSPVSDNTVDDLDFPPLDGSLNQRRLRTSLWEVPHRITVLVAGDLPLGIRAALFYEGSSGTAFTYQVDGDANADGLNDDIVYVPQDVRPGGDVSLAEIDQNTQTIVAASPAEYDRLARFIEHQPCLRASRGRIMPRNSCRAPWTDLTWARLSKLFQQANGHSVEVTVDVFNLLHLLDRDWGLVRGSDDRLLRLVGYDQANGRGLYQRVDVHDVTDEGSSRWRIQMGARYRF